MAKRITVSLDETLEQALAEAPSRLNLDAATSASERLREYARRGYDSTLEEERLATYRRWADDDEIALVGRALSRRAAERGAFAD